MVGRLFDEFGGSRTNDGKCVSHMDDVGGANVWCWNSVHADGWCVGFEEDSIVG